MKPAFQIADFRSVFHLRKDLFKVFPEHTAGNTESFHHITPMAILTPCRDYALEKNHLFFVLSCPFREGAPGRVLLFPPGGPALPARRTSRNGFPRRALPSGSRSAALAQGAVSCGSAGPGAAIFCSSPLRTAVLFGRSHRNEAFARSLGDSVFGQTLNLPQQIRFIRRDQGDGDPRFSGPACSAYPVYIVFRIPGKIKVHHMAETFKVDPSGRHISGDQSLKLPAPEILQSTNPGVSGFYRRE